MTLSKNPTFPNSINIPNIITMQYVLQCTHTLTQWLNHASNCIARRIVLQLCLYTTVRLMVGMWARIIRKKSRDNFSQPDLVVILLSQP